MLPKDKKMKIETIQTYIKAIHNKDKKLYAIAYYNYLHSNKTINEPQYKNLSYMGAQAVRMNLNNLTNE
jgi:hypothetical protein